MDEGDMMSGGKKKVKDPWLSIVTIVKNGAATLEKAIDSVNELGEDVEYIVIDGNSTDGTKEILKKREDDITSFISEPDTGIYQAMNKGIRLCTGSLIGILSSNDSYNHTIAFADKLKQKHLKEPQSVIYGSIACFKDGKYQHTIGWISDRIFQHMIPHPSSFVPKKVYERFGYYDESYQIAGDYEWFLRYKLQGGAFHFFNGVLANFDLGGISNAATEKIEEDQKIRTKYLLDSPDGAVTQIPKASFLRKVIKRVYHKLKKSVKILIP